MLVVGIKSRPVYKGLEIDIHSARHRRDAESWTNMMAKPNARRRIFDYGTNRQTRETCRYLHNINN